MKKRLEGQVVLVTGGSRGIGRAIALRLAEECPKHIVIAYCMNHDAARQTLNDIRALGVSASVEACDVGNETLQKEMFARIHAVWGRLDVFVANAARMAYSAAMDLNLRSWRRTMELNAEAFLVGVQLAAGIMKNNDGGRIVGLSSLGSRYYVPNYAALGAAKSAIENLARNFAVELAPHKINVNVVCGGFIDTDSVKLLPAYKNVTEAIVARTPVGRLGVPQDLAGIVAFLCSAESDWIRGQTIVADGGFCLSL
jgi:NAD(P)-dependent dehydrogenase (short-subunit alcohol dehydrogenase family)